MEVQDMIDHVQSALTVKRVFGEPVERGGVTVIPAALIGGGAGGGSGEAEREGSGSGSGFGLGARPAGVYVIQEGKVQWRPALDTNRIIMRAQLVLALALLTFRALLKARLRAQEQEQRRKKMLLLKRR